jgi:hypothetical protein
MSPKEKLIESWIGDYRGILMLIFTSVKILCLDSTLEKVTHMSEAADLLRSCLCGYVMLMVLSDPLSLFLPNNEGELG